MGMEPSCKTGGWVYGGGQSGGKLKGYEDTENGRDWLYLEPLTTALPRLGFDWQHCHCDLGSIRRA